MPYKSGSGKMNFREWRTFVENITAGIFGGIVVLSWSLAYEKLESSPLLLKTFFPMILTLIFFVFLILFIQFQLGQLPIVFLDS